MNSTLSYLENFTGNEYEGTVKHNEIHMKNKENTFATLTPHESHEPKPLPFIKSL